MMVGLAESMQAILARLQELRAEFENGVPQMADRFYGIDRGASRATVAAAQQNTDIELIIDDAVGLEKKEIIVLLERLKEEILQDDGFTTGG